MNDDNGFSLTTVLASIATFLTTIAGAYAVFRKTKSDTQQAAASTAQSTVQSTLDAMQLVVTGLTSELSRRQTELDTLRLELVTTRKHERELEITTGKQEARIAVMEEQIRNMNDKLSRLEKRADKQDSE